MKTKLTLGMLLLSFLAFCQVPSINQTNINKIDINKPLLKLSKDKITILEKTLNDFKKQKNDLVKAKGDNKAFNKDSLDIEISKTERLIETVQNQKKVAESDLAAIEDPSRKSFERYYRYEERKIEDKLKASYKLLNDTLKPFIDKKTLDSIVDAISTDKKALKKLQFERDVKLDSFDGFQWFMPSVKRTNRENFFSSMYNNTTTETHYVNSFALSTDSKNVAAQSEIITDNLNMFRISFGTVVTSTSGDTTDDTTTASTRLAAEEDTPEETETAEAALKRLINGGGNFYLDITLPLVITNDENEGWITSYTYTNLVGGMDIKGFGNDLDTSTGNGSLGISSYIGASSDNKKFNFFIQGNLNYTMGSDDFYKNLALRNEKGFLNGKLIAGITLLNTFKVSAILSQYGSDEAVRSGEVAIGLQILPGL
jgi:hypothetical protein